MSAVPSNAATPAPVVHPTWGETGHAEQRIWTIADSAQRPDDLATVGGGQNPKRRMAGGPCRELSRDVVRVAGREQDDEWSKSVGKSCFLPGCCAMVSSIRMVPECKSTGHRVSGVAREEQTSPRSWEAQNSDRTHETRPNLWPRSHYRHRAGRLQSTKRLRANSPRTSAQRGHSPSTSWLSLASSRV